MAEEAPRWLDRKALAIHISVRVDYVSRLVKSGKLPAPSYHLGPKSPRWDRLAVDACFEGEMRSASRSVDEAVQALVEKIERGDALGSGTGTRRRGR